AARAFRAPASLWRRLSQRPRGLVARRIDRHAGVRRRRLDGRLRDRVRPHDLTPRPACWLMAGIQEEKSWTMADIHLDHVRKTFGAVEVVPSLDLAIPDGSFTVLLGPSGCGKSTLLRMIAGLETVTDGVIRIGSRVVNNIEPSERDIAMVFQNYALYPHMTVWDNMAYGLKNRGTPKDEIVRRVTEAARLLELEPLLKRRPRELSGGQRQRVAMGRAIVREPQVFLFDEPLSNLDAKLRVQTRIEIRRLHNRLKA